MNERLQFSSSVFDQNKEEVKKPIPRIALLKAAAGVNPETNLIYKRKPTEVDYCKAEEILKQLESSLKSLKERSKGYRFYRKIFDQLKKISAVLAFPLYALTLLTPIVGGVNVMLRGKRSDGRDLFDEFEEILKTKTEALIHACRSDEEKLRQFEARAALFNDHPKEKK